MAASRVCVFCEKWESGGIESVIAGILMHTDLSELEVHIVSPHIGESIFTAPLCGLGVKFIQLCGRVRSGKNYRMLRELLRRNRYDAAHFHIFHGVALRYVRIAESCGVTRRLVHCHGSGLRRSVTRPLKLLLHRIARFIWRRTPTHRFAPSREAGRFLFGKEDFTLLDNAIAPERFAFRAEERNEVRTSLGLTDSTVLLGHVGRFSSEKNQRFLLEVFCEYKKINSDSRLILVGDGEEKEALSAHARHLSVLDDVIFFGTTDNVRRILCAMDIFVFPSVVEGFGIVALEAQANGLTVLCSEAIPGNVHVTPLISSLPLGLGANGWANAVDDRIKSAPRRGAVAVSLPEELDIRNAAGRIAAYYYNKSN